MKRLIVSVATLAAVLAPPALADVKITDQPGFWERYGYHNDADPWEEERYGF